jgi:hypothetical protein
VVTDLRQIKSEPQSILTLLKQEQKLTPASVSNDDLSPEPFEGSHQDRPRTYFVFCERREGMMMLGK